MPAFSLKSFNRLQHTARAGFVSLLGGTNRLAKIVRSRSPRFKIKRLKPRAVWRASKKKAANVHRRLTGGFIRGPETLADNIRYFANPGPAFEYADKLQGQHLESNAKTIAFYLPQFHAFDENDEWWGAGFTEWRNVARGTPRFRGHYQPRVPRDLGFYDLNNIDTIQAQCDLAKHNGIDAFCFYYYWFNGKRLMEKPLDLFAESDIDQQFCIMWANENWTRTWDGLDNDVLIEQDYLDEDEDDFIADTARYMADQRYVRLNGQPLFILYRPALLNKPTATLARWRKKWTALLGEAPLIMMVQGFGEEDPRDFGLDGAVEFPPHKVCAGLENINERCHFLDSNYKGTVRDYESVVDNALKEDKPQFPLIKTVSPHWDNDARREGLGMTVHGSTPALYEKWLRGAIDFATQNPVNDESVVFINAWNEWAEGAYLEPDVHFGHAYLNATKRAIKGLPAAGETKKLLLVGHDAYKHGAQMLLINMAKIYTQSFGMEVVILLKEGGPLVADYQRIAPTHVLSKMGKSGLKKLLSQHQFKAAICNTSVTGDVIPVLKTAGIRVVSLIHEMPNLIRDYKLETNIQSIADHADHVVYPANIVRWGFEEFTDTVDAHQVIKPQGTYTPIHFNASARVQLREELGIGVTDKVVIGVGYADLRKGFDLFVDAARRFNKRTNGTASKTPVHFVWVGALNADMSRWIQADFSNPTTQENTANLSAKKPASNLHIIGYTDRVKEYYSMADCLFLPSREDPYPTVVLEAMHIGLPVIAFNGTTGCDELLGTYGYLAQYGDNDNLDSAIVTALAEGENEAMLSQQGNRKDYVNDRCQFDDYCFSLLELLHPSLQRVSVVVPIVASAVVSDVISGNKANVNQSADIESLLSSIFMQNTPVFEVIVIDNNLSDNSLAAIEHVAKRAGRVVRIVRHTESQLHSGANEARCRFIWIAQTSNSVDAGFIETTLNSFSERERVVFNDAGQEVSAEGIIDNSNTCEEFQKVA